MTRVVALIATVPERRVLCERLLAELAKQSRPPDAVILVLDGYGEALAPVTTLPITATRRAAALRGPGSRWLDAIGCTRRASSIAPHFTEGPLHANDIIVCIDDDAVLLDAPEFVAGLVMAVERGQGAAAAMGRDAEGRVCLPGSRSCGLLMHAAGLGLTVRARHLEGLPEFAASVVAAGGPDGLGPLGDDDALVSAYLWKKGVPIFHAATGNIFEAPAGKASSFSRRREGQGQARNEQKEALRRVTGWPFVACVRG